ITGLWRRWNGALQSSTSAEFLNGGLSSTSAELRRWRAEFHLSRKTFFLDYRPLAPVERRAPGIGADGTAPSSLAGWRALG
ncbi:MAG: hypothetical protein RML49_04755, partial [Verrucomicrobiae bacterium]|nr:hypothetical protein [Verrucomicrobiae bacterium]